MRSRIAGMRMIKSIFVPAVVLIVWQIVSGAVSPYLLPGPGRVLETGLAMAKSGVLTEHVLSSFYRIAAGFCLSVVLAFGTAALLYRWRLLDELFLGLFFFLCLLFLFVFLFLLILWLATQIAVFVLASFFPIYLNTRDGLSRLDASFRELAASLHLSRTRTVLFFLLPAATPSIITGLRLSCGYSWRALIAAELIAASSGLGYMIMDAEQMQRADEVIVGILIIGFLGWALDAAFSSLSSALLKRRFPELAS